MADSKFTPGPWRVEADIAEHPQWFRVAAADGNICVPCYGRDPRGIDEANAHLIAAAPDYHDHAYRLAMLVLQSPLYRADADVRQQVDVVLAIHRKAEGR